MLENESLYTKEGKQHDFVDYWDSLGFFENLQLILPTKFFVLFNIARVIFTGEKSNDALNAIEEISKQEMVYRPDRDESIRVNRVERISPVSDHMEIDTFRKIYDLKKALPRELAMDDDILDMKIFTKTLLVQKFFETEADSFKPVSTSRDERGKDANRFEQKFYILLDRSRSMDLKMRSFYSKCLVAEFLRRKRDSRTQLFYRPFDSKPGKLFKILKPEDFPLLVETVLLTTTGGKSTNIQAAVLQAVRDILYDKDMIKAEILVVTDGISKVDKFTMKKELGDIKLHVLKIGDELANPDFYDMEQDFRGTDFDPSSVNLKDVRRKLDTAKTGKTEAKLDQNEQRVLRKLMDFSESMTKDLREIARSFIEIEDLHAEGLFVVTPENIEEIRGLVRRFTDVSMKELDLNAKKSMYKQVYFLAQYIEMLMENGNAGNAELRNCLDSVQHIKEKLLKDPELLLTIVQVQEFDEDKKIMKLAKKEARRLMKQMTLNQQDISIKDMKRAQLLFTGNVDGKGNLGRFILLLMIKFWQFLTGGVRRLAGKKQQTDETKP